MPGTWSQLSTWASEQHDPPGRYGLALCVERVQGTCLFLSLLASLGQVAFGETGAVLERDSATFVLQSVRDLLRFASRRGIDTLGHPGMCTSASRTTTDVAYCPALFGYVNYFGLERRGCGWG